MINYKLLSISLLAPFLSLAVVIRPIDVFSVPKRIKVAPYLFYKSKDTPPIRHNWKKEVVCLSDSPKCNKYGI